MRIEIKKAGTLALALFGCLISVESLWAQDILDTSKPLDESLLFGGSGDIVKEIDTMVASTSIVELVADTKTYPLFLLEGSGSVGLAADIHPLGASGSDKDGFSGTARMSGFSLTFLPARDAQFELTGSGSISSGGDISLDGSLSTDLRASEFTRFSGTANFGYQYGAGTDSATTSFGLEEFFLDTAIDRKVFFRLGKQRISWGVGTWYQPADVLSLAAIDPDNPTASREGPFAFKIDVPFALNHATLYLVPPTEDSLRLSAAGKVDFVVGGFEVSLGGFARTDGAAAPRAMALFTGTAGDFDLYGENVVAWGSDRLYVRKAAGGGSYETYRIADAPVAQSTLGVKYSFSLGENASGSLHLQGYYNGSGYLDSGILGVPAAKAALASAGASPSDKSAKGAGMFYLAGSGSVSFDFGEDETRSSLSLSGSGLYNFSDGSARITPSLSLALGSSRDFSLSLGAQASLGEIGSEYASNGNRITPTLSARLFGDLSLSVSAPILMGADYLPDKVDASMSLSWGVFNFGS